MPRRTRPRPTSTQALKSIVAAHVQKSGPLCSLNHIDVSGISHFDSLFEGSDFNGDISQWDVSGARSLNEMFMDSRFNGDISQWDVSNAKDFSGMFMNSPFNGDLSKWDTGSAVRMEAMFFRTPFAGDISDWNVSGVTHMDHMFEYATQFQGDVSRWDVSQVCQFGRMFSQTDWAGDVRTWNILPSASVVGMFSSETLKRMPGPNHFHWLQLLCQGPQGWEPTEWIEHAQLVRLATDGLGLLPMVAAKEMHTAWNTRHEMRPEEALALPADWMQEP